MIGHGVRRYEAGCRCDECREGKRIDNARYRQRRKERLGIVTYSQCKDCGKETQPNTNPDIRCVECCHKYSSIKERRKAKRSRLTNIKHTKGKQTWYVDSAGAVSKRPYKDCLWCNKTRDIQRMYCSVQCNDRAKKFNRRGRMKNNGGYEYINRAQVIAQSNGVCNVCSGGIDEAIKYPHEQSIAIDHVIALANGGQHNYKNVAASHWICNAFKRDLSLEDARDLVGVGV